jgi:hypothetical protein
VDQLLAAARFTYTFWRRKKFGSGKRRRFRSAEIFHRSEKRLYKIVTDMPRFSFFMLLFFSTTFFFSCNPAVKKEKTADSVIDSPAVQVIKPKPKSPIVFVLPALKNSSGKLEWNIMNGLPAIEMEGCGCWLSKNEEEILKNKFLCIMDFDSLAVISINNKVTQLLLLQTNQEQNSFPGDTLHSIYSNGRYSLEIKVKYIRKDGDETDLYSGKAILRSSSKEVEMNVTGECGC